MLSTVALLVLLSAAFGAHIELPLTTRAETYHAGNYVHKRGLDLYEVPLYHSGVNYEAYIKVGSQQTPIGVLVDTGSADLTVQSVKNPNCDWHSFDLSVPQAPWMGKYNPPNENGSDYTTTYQFHLETYFQVNKTSGIAEFLEDSGISVAPPEYQQVNLSSYNSMKIDIVNCGLSGQFDSTQSSSFQNLSIPYSATFLDKSIYYGTYGIDSVTIGNSTLELQFGLVTESSYGAGSLLGMGFPSLEAGVSYGLPQYNNFPLALKSAGLIDRAAYSLVLNQDSPSLLLSAVDVGQAANLTRVPIYKTMVVGRYAQKARYVASTLNAFGLSSASPDLTGAIPVVFDSGTMISFFTPKMNTAILDRYPFEEIGSSAHIIHKEALGNDMAYFNFAGHEVGVALADIFEPLTFSNGTASPYLMFKTNMALSSNTYAVLGQDVLRNLVLVVDLEGEELAIAEHMSTREHNVIPIGKNGLSAIQGIGEAPQKGGMSLVPLDWNSASKFGAWRRVLQYII